MTDRLWFLRPIVSLEMIQDRYSTVSSFAFFIPAPQIAALSFFLAAALLYVYLDQHGLKIEYLKELPDLMKQLQAILGHVKDVPKLLQVSFQPCLYD